jgi:CxxC motif-containing protein (DUF1111 family)
MKQHLGKATRFSAWMASGCIAMSWALSGCGGSAAAVAVDGGPVDPGAPVPPAPLGESIAGLTATERNLFIQGRDSFAAVEDAADGLGPVFNGRSCGECHSSGALGGAATNIGVARVTRIGGIEAGKYSDLVNYGGPVLQARSLREDIPNYPHPGEVIPPQARFVSRRITTPLFGAGLMEAIPGEAIIARSRLNLSDGVRGVPNMVVNPLNGRTEVGRFGWKAQHSNLEVFSADAYLNEMGITTPLDPKENNPQGLPIAPGADLVGDPEDQEDAELFANFMRFLAPPVPTVVTNITQRGEQIFNQIACTNCHVPTMRTGQNAVAALSNKAVALYSDLLLHRMGPQLADGIVQGNAQGDMFRTAPLWGLGRRRFYLHDGRATTVEAAILNHGGEATNARNRFMNLNQADKGALRDFLNSL